MDVMGSLPPCNNKQYIAIFIDSFSRYVIAVPTANHKVLTITQLLLQHVILAFSIPGAIFSNQGTQFTSHLWEHLGVVFGYKLIHTSPYYAQGNGICERIHHTINNAIRASNAHSNSVNWL